MKLKSPLLVISSLALSILFAACANERTTTYEDPRAKITNRTTVDQTVNQSSTLPSQNPEFVEIISTKKDGKAAEKLYEALHVLEVAMEKPENVLCEFIPQTRLKKSLGRLECLKMFPTDNEDPSLTSYRCQIKYGNDDELKNYDESLFQQLNTNEEFNPHGYLGYRTYSKTIGRFHCHRMISESTQQTRFECGVDMIYKAILK